MTAKYQRLQNQTLRKITGTYHNSPIKALEVEAAILPTKVWQQKQATNYALRLLRLQPSHPVQAKLITPIIYELSLVTELDLDIFNYLNNGSSQLTKIGCMLWPFTHHKKLEKIDASWAPPWLQANLSITISPKPKEMIAIEHKLLECLSFTRRLVQCISLLLSHCLDDSANTANWTFAVFIDRNNNNKNQYLTFVPFVLHWTNPTYT